MPQPAENRGTTRTPMTRSEAARHASLVRWKKESRLAPQTGGMANPKIRARVAEILAEKAKKKAPKPKAKPKGAKGKAKPKTDGRTPQEKANQNRAAVAKQGGMEKLEGVMVRLGAGMTSDLEKDAHEDLIKKGLVERGADGKPKLTAAGKKWRSAADKGDISAAQGAIAAGAEGVAKKEATEKAKGEKTAAREKAKIERATAAEAKKQERIKKVAERQQQAQQKRKKQKKAREKVKRDPSAKEVVADALASMRPSKKAIDMPVIEIPDVNSSNYTFSIKAGARHSKTDLQHLQGIHDSSVACGASCGAESDEADDVDTETAEKAIKSIMDNPQYYAQHECGDVMQAASALQTIVMLIQSELSEEDEDTADVSQLVDATRTLVTFISGELDKLEGAADDAASTTVGDRPMKGIETTTLEDGEEIAMVSGYNIKAIGDAGWVGGYLVKFGGDGDLSQWHDVFTKDTNFGKHTKSDVWVHHRMLPGLGKKQLTNQADLGMDDEGVFVKHLLDLRNAYESKLYDMVQSGKLGWSSGTAPHLVERKALGDGRHEVTQWTLGLDASYTPMPAGGFVVNAGAMKSLFDDAGVDLLNAIYIDDSQEAINPDAAKADGRQAVDDERARALSLELDLIELETS